MGSLSDNKIDDVVVKAKAEAAKAIAAASRMEYKMYVGSDIMNKHVLHNYYADKSDAQESSSQATLSFVAENMPKYGTNK